MTTASSAAPTRPTAAMMVCQGTSSQLRLWVLACAGESWTRDEPDWSPFAPSKGIRSVRSVRSVRSGRSVRELASVITAVYPLAREAKRSPCSPPGVTTGVGTPAFELLWKSTAVVHFALLRGAKVVGSALIDLAVALLASGVQGDRH